MIMTFSQTGNCMTKSRLVGFPDKYLSQPADWGLGHGGLFARHEQVRRQDSLFLD